MLHCGIFHDRLRYQIQVNGPMCPSYERRAQFQRMQLVISTIKQEYVLVNVQK